MKTLIFFALLVFISGNALSQSNWVSKNTYEVKDCNNFGNLKFFDENTGYASNTLYPVRDVIFKTVNGGQNWIAIPGPSTDLGSYTFYFKDVNTIYALTNEYLYKSTNSGTTWNFVNIIDSLNQYPSCGLFFNDDLNGYISFGQKLAKTTDGGITWTYLNYIPQFTALNSYFFDQNKFFIASGYPDGYTSPSKLLKTDNGGLNWTIMIDLNNYDGSMINNLKFINNNTGICISELPYAPAHEVLGRIATNLFVTTDGGNSWSRNEISLPYFTNTSISEDLSIDMVCSDGYLYHSTDMGTTFTKKYYNALLSNIVKIKNSSVKYLTGDFNAFYRSVDAGNSFTDISSSSSSHNNLRSVSFGTSSTGFAVGSRGTILKSTNGGESFFRITNQNGIYSDTVNYHYVKMFDHNNGIIAGDQAFVKTSDGGNTWQNMSMPVQNISSIDKVEFLDKEHGTVRLSFFRGDPKDYYTSNGGSSWQMIAADTSYGDNYYPHQYDSYEYLDFKTTQDKVYIKVYHYSSSNFGSDISNGLRIFNIPNSHLTSSQKERSSYIRNISFVKSNDNQIVFCNYDDFNQSYNTLYTNRGDSIFSSINSYMPTFSYGIGNNIYYGLGQNASDGFVGQTVSSYRFQKSINIGQSWNRGDSLTTFNPSQLYFIDNNTGFIIGDGGMILKTSNGGNVGVGNTNTSLPDKFILQQNYPNPFNPVTKINFSLPVLSRITLKVYDVLGREVAVLLNSELRTAGNYSVSFDGSKYSSGVYFYKFVNEGNSGQSITKKCCW